jgi:cbb3-type cytochrome oxidase subunit 3
MKKSNLFWGSAIVVLGALLLANTMGVLSVNVWAFFWPALVILAGVWFLLKSSQKGKNVEAVASNIPLEGATSAEIEFNHGAGRLEVDARANAGDLISGSFVGGVTANIDRSSGNAKVSLHTPTDLVFDGPWAFGGHGYEWKVGVTNTIPVKLRFHTGASESLLDLRGIKVEEVSLETGASSSEMTLPDTAGFTKAQVKSGVASVKIRVPDGVAADIRVDSGLSGIDVDTNRFVRDGNNYRSADYATAANKVQLLVESGVGSVEIR